MDRNAAIITGSGSHWTVIRQCGHIGGFSSLEWAVRFCENLGLVYMIDEE